MTTTVASTAPAARVNLWVDLALFAASLLALSPNFTGLSVHEWLGLSLGAGLLLHLLLHWQWIAVVLRRFLGPLPATVRFNLLLNAALFIDLVIIIFTGGLISREALPRLGITLAGGQQWSGLHRFSADLSLALIGLHVAVHWQWIANATRRYLMQPVLGLFRPPAPRPAAATLLNAKVK